MIPAERLLRYPLPSGKRLGEVLTPDDWSGWIGSGARVAYSPEQARDESGRWTDDGGGGVPEGQEPFPGMDATPAEWTAYGVAKADAWTGTGMVYVQDTPLGYDPETGEQRATDDFAFTPGTAEALTESVGQYIKSFENASEIYEAGQVLAGHAPPTDDAPEYEAPYAWAREMMNAMAGEGPDEDAYSPFAVGGEYDGPTPMLVMTMNDEDELVRGTGDRGIVDDFREAMESGEPVEWPFASFGWGGQAYEDYTAALTSMSGEKPDDMTIDQSALHFATREGYDPVLISTRGPVEGALVIDGEHEVLVGGAFRVVDVREEEIPTGAPFDPDDPESYDNWQTEQIDEETGELVEDENGDTVPLDEPVYIGPTTTVTRVVVEQVEGPKAVA